MARKFVQRYSDHLVRAKCPKNIGVEPNEVLDDAAGATSSFKVYDDPRVKDGLDADVEIRFNGGPGLADFGVLCITIQEDECD